MSNYMPVEEEMRMLARINREELLFLKREQERRHRIKREERKQREEKHRRYAFRMERERKFIDRERQKIKLRIVELHRQERETNKEKRAKIETDQKGQEKLQRRSLKMEAEFSRNRQRLKNEYDTTYSLVVPKTTIIRPEPKYGSKEKFEGKYHLERSSNILWSPISSKITGLSHLGVKKVLTYFDTGKYQSREDSYEGDKYYCQSQWDVKSSENKSGGVVLSEAPEKSSGGPASTKIMEEHGDIGGRGINECDIGLRGRSDRKRKRFYSSCDN